MESVAAFRPFKSTMSHMHIKLKGSGIIPVHTTWPISGNPCIQGLTVGGKLISSPTSRNEVLVSCIKTSGTAVTAKTDESRGSPQKNPMRRATFPSGLEALVLEVCDETEVAEVKLKIGDFEMHMKRNIGATVSPPPIASPTTPPPIPGEPMVESASLNPLLAPPPKSTSEKISPFTNVSSVKASKLASLEASGSNAYVLVSSPTVGTFRRGRTLKGTRQPPICKEGNVIKEGQVIGFLDQFGTELPVKSDVSGEVLKILFDDGEAVGYGDPLIAVLPSFHGIK